MDFWLDLPFTARKSFLAGRPADGDPLLTAFYDWFRKIDAATAKAEAEGFCYFSFTLVDRGERIAVRFYKDDGKSFVRTLAITANISHNGSEIKPTEIVDIIVALQTILAHEGRVRFPGTPVGSKWPPPGVST